VVVGPYSNETDAVVAVPSDVRLPFRTAERAFTLEAAPVVTAGGAADTVPAGNSDSRMTRVTMTPRNLLNFMANLPKY
jgi:hypothetical protein